MAQQLFAPLMEDFKKIRLNSTTIRLNSTNMICYIISMTNKKTWLEKELEHIEEDLSVINSLAYRRHWYEQLTMKRIKNLYKKISNKELRGRII